jgi:hypothetical protein
MNRPVNEPTDQPASQSIHQTLHTYTPTLPNQHRTHLLVAHAREDLGAVDAGDGAVAAPEMVLHLRLLERLVAAFAGEEDHGCFALLRGVR